MFRVALLLVLSVSGMFLLVVVLGNRFVFYPSSYPEGRWEPAEGGDRWLEETFPAEDGVKLHAWWAPEDKEKTLLWMHGNSGNITHRIEALRDIHGYGLQVFLFDYRGYGKSEGTPSEEGVYRDARAAFRYLVDQKGISPDHLYLFGRSLGGAVATKLATEVDCGGIILQSTFTSIRDMSGASLPIPLLYLVLRTKMDSLSRIDNVGMPLLMIHGSEDDVVPASLGRRLFEAANEPKYWLELDGAGHDDLRGVDPDLYRSTLLRFVKNPQALCASGDSVNKEG